MRRYATAPLSTFEDLFDRARAGIVRLDALEYPPVCAAPSGEVSFVLGRTGAMIMHVSCGECSSPEFRLRLLFETGACVFASPEDLGAFCTGALAAAFEIEATDPITAPLDATGEAVRHGREAASPSADTVLEDGGLPTEATTRNGQADEAIGDLADALLFPSPTPSSRALTSATLSTELARVIHGQEPALERVASATIAQLTKRHPACPGSVLLIGPSGVGKTSTIEALPNALRALGFADARVFRVDCGELTDSIQLTRLLGSPPGYSGHAQTTPLIAALERPGCILLVDELEKAHDHILEVLLGLLDAGRLTTPSGRVIDARHVFVALTTTVSSRRLADRLETTPLEDRWTVRRACVEHLRSSGLPADLLARIGAFAVYRDVVEEVARTEIARAAITALGSEYGLIVVEVDSVVLQVVEDIATDGGGTDARSLQHAARELLAEQLADRAGDGARVRVKIVAGPPIAIHPVTTVRQNR